MEREQYLEVYRHSLAHVLAKAVIELFGAENVQYAIGPQISDGFYYDFMLPRTLNKDDFPTIENKMREILKRKEDWQRIEVSKQEALELFKDQKYKTETIIELPDDETITIYKTGDDFTDLCRGPHIDNSKELMSAAFKIKSVSGSYWKGDEHNDQLQRIYVYAFPDKQELKAHLDLVKEAMERDHKKLGPQLDLFMFDPTAPGMPYWLPRGWKLYNALLNYWRGVHEVHGYTEISAPVINNKEIWETSGHWGHYRTNMFCIQEDGEDYWAVKPMNCPNAVKVYQREQHSYKDLPIRLNTVDVIHRKEKSGELNGLFRVQLFRQDDSHNLITEDQIEEEIHDIMSIADEIYGTLGLTYRAELSTRPEDFMGDIALWDQAEASLKRILDAAQSEGAPVLGIVDEVLRGTNTIERISASSQILRRLTDTNAVIFAATHDIELSYILEKYYNNYHFTEQITDGDVRFDYVLREGRATSRNAIALLTISGYGEDISRAAREQAERFEQTGEWRL